MVDGGPAAFSPASKAITLTHASYRSQVMGPSPSMLVAATRELDTGLHRPFFKAFTAFLSLPPPMPQVMGSSPNMLAAATRELDNGLHRPALKALTAPLFPPPLCRR